MSVAAESPKAIIAEAASRHGIDPALLWGVFGTETSFGKDVKASSAGAVGPLQLEPATAQSLGVRNPNDLAEAANGAAKYLAEFKSRGVGGMLSAYNAGPAGGYQSGYVNSTLANAKTYGGASTATAIPGLTGSKGSALGVLKPATVQSAGSLDLPAFEAAQQKVAANRFVASNFGGTVLPGLLDLTAPNPSQFETTPATAAPAQPTGPVGNLPAPQEASKALSAAVTQLGTPYKWGGETERQAFDCSGLTQWAYRAAGIAIPRTAQEQYNASHESTGTPQPGQLVFFGSSPTNVTHVEMVVGGGKMIGADHSGTNVRYENLPAVGSQWGEDKVLGIGTPTGQPGGTPKDASVAPSAGTIVGAYKAPTGEPRVIAHHATGKVEHVASALPTGHPYQTGDVLGMPLTRKGQGH